MIYQVRIKNHAKNVKVYVILKRLGRSPSILTKLFLKLLKQDEAQADKGSATEKLR
jgi:hypothetical protein